MSSGIAYWPAPDVCDEFHWGGGDRIVTLCNVQCLRQISLGEDCIVTLVHQTKYILLKQSASDTQA